MSDIADKIYAATGLTLGAEAAAAVEKMIQAENEKLRAALQQIADTDPDEGTSWFHDVANAALGEKE